MIRRFLFWACILGVIGVIAVYLLSFAQNICLYGGDIPGETDTSFISWKMMSRDPVSGRFGISAKVPFGTEHRLFVQGVHGRLRLGWVRLNGNPSLAGTFRTTSPLSAPVARDFGPIRFGEHQGICTFNEAARTKESHRYLFPVASGSVSSQIHYVDMHLAVTGVLIGLYPSVFLAISLFRKRRRRTHGQCVRCGYSLTGAVESRCPECGTKTKR